MTPHARFVRRGTSLPSVVVVALLAAAVVGCKSSSNDSSNNNTFTATFAPASGLQLPDAAVGQVYSQTFTLIAGGTAPYVFGSVAIPPGLVLTQVGSNACSISGTPTQSGTGTLIFQAGDANSKIATASYVLAVVPAGATLTVTPSTLPAGRVGQAYSQVLGISGGVPGYVWATSGTLPPGLALGTSSSGTNTLSGIPTQSGTFSFSVNVGDAASPQGKGSTTYSLLIQP